MVRYSNILFQIESYIERNGLDVDDTWLTLDETTDVTLKAYNKTYTYLKDKLNKYAKDRGIHSDIVWDEVNQYHDEVLKDKLNQQRGLKA